MLCVCVCVCQRVAEEADDISTINHRSLGSEVDVSNPRAAIDGPRAPLSLSRVRSEHTRVLSLYPINIDQQNCYRCCWLL